MNDPLFADEFALLPTPTDLEAEAAYWELQYLRDAIPVEEFPDSDLTDEEAEAMALYEDCRD